MKNGLWAVMAAVVVATSLAPSLSEAKRMGGGKSIGLQRAAPAPRSSPAPEVPAKPAANPGAAATPPVAGAPVVPPKRSWMGPLVGLAAGLGIGALMSHFGMGAGMGNLLTMVLLAGLAFFAIRFLMQHFGRGGMGSSPAWAAAPAGSTGGWPAANPASSNTPLMRQAEPTAVVPLQNGAASFAVPAAADLATPVSSAAVVPVGFDAAGFQRIAKLIFIRMQAANDTSDLNDLRQFTTPEMFAAVRLDLQERGASAQQTDVVQVEADVIEFTQEAERQVVSVRFHGLIREEPQAPTQAFDEVWHLVQPKGAGASWLIAGIQQQA